MRGGRHFAIFSLLYLPSSHVWASPIYPTSLSPRILSGLVAREEPHAGLQIGMPVIVTITVPGLESTTACIQRFGSSLNSCSERLPLPTAVLNAPTNAPQEPANTYPVISSVPPALTPDPAVQETTVTLSCGSDLSPIRDPGDLNPTTTAGQSPLESGAFVPVPSVVEQDSITTVHISTTITEYVALPAPATSAPAQQHDSQPPGLTPSPSTPQFTSTPYSLSFASDTPAPPLPTPESEATNPFTSLAISTSTPVPAPEVTTRIDTNPGTPDDRGPAIEIIPVS